MPAQTDRKDTAEQTPEERVKDHLRLRLEMWKKQSKGRFTQASFESFVVHEVDMIEESLRHIATNAVVHVELHEDMLPVTLEPWEYARMRSVYDNEMRALSFSLDGNIIKLHVYHRIAN